MDHGASCNPSSLTAAVAEKALGGDEVQHLTFFSARGAQDKRGKSLIFFFIIIVFLTDGTWQQGIYCTI